MFFWIIHILLFSILVLAKELVHEDILHFSVPKLYTTGFICLTLGLRLTFLLESGFSDSGLWTEMLHSLLRAIVLLLPLILIYLWKKLPGIADIKYCFCIGLLLSSYLAHLILIAASVWALVIEYLKNKRENNVPLRFAFLPYLIAVSLPFVFINYWTLGGGYGKNY